MTSRFTLIAPVSARQEIKKSRFAAYASPITSEDDAKAFLSEHADATAGHNCWAWRLGRVYRFNDDGEPSGTAGKPILQAIDGQNLDGVAVLVSRWFGGILLGGGGLIRAYGGTAALALRAGEMTEVIEMTSCVVRVVFGDLALIQSRIAGHEGASISAQDFSDFGAMLTVTLPRAGAEAFAAMLVDMTSGRTSVIFPDQDTE